MIWNPDQRAKGLEKANLIRYRTAGYAPTKALNAPPRVWVVMQLKPLTVTQKLVYNSKNRKRSSS